MKHLPRFRFMLLKSRPADEHYQFFFTPTFERLNPNIMHNTKLQSKSTFQRVAEMNEGTLVDLRDRHAKDDPIIDNPLIKHTLEVDAVEFGPINYMSIEGLAG